MNFELFSAINGLAGRFGPLDALMVFSAQYLITVMYAIGAVVVGLRIRRDGWWPAGALRLGQVLATVLISFALSFFVETFNLSQRPFQTHQVHLLIAHDPGVSLPSDHATGAFALAIAVWLFVSRKWGPYFVFTAAVISFARVFVGIHFPADVAASALIAVIVGFAVWGATLALSGRFLSRSAAAATA